jgi:DNA-binding ferritin-like protein
MFDTRNDLPANTRTKVIELLNARLADAIDLGAHTDTLAERVTALGGTARAEPFTGISRDKDKDLWFLEAHLHAKR